MGENIFYQHLLPLQHQSPILNNKIQLVWPALLLISAFAMIVLLKVIAYPKLAKILHSTYNTQVQAQLEREEFNPFKLYSILLNVLYIISFAFLCYKVNRYYHLINSNSDTFIQFVFFTLILFLVYGVKFMANKSLILLTNEFKPIYEFENNCNLINQATGMFMLPWLILSELSRFNPIIFISGAIVVLMASILIKWYRGTVIALVKQRIGILQILTYFCALEILPTLVLVKYLIETF